MLHYDGALELYFNRGFRNSVFTGLEMGIGGAGCEAPPNWTFPQIIFDRYSTEFEIRQPQMIEGGAYGTVLQNIFGYSRQDTSIEVIDHGRGIEIRTPIHAFSNALNWEPLGDWGESRPPIDKKPWELDVGFPWIVPFSADPEYFGSSGTAGIWSPLLSSGWNRHTFPIGKVYLLLKSPNVLIASTRLPRCSEIRPEQALHVQHSLWQGCRNSTHQWFLDFIRFCWGVSSQGFSAWRIGVGTNPSSELNKYSTIANVQEPDFDGYQQTAVNSWSITSNPSVDYYEFTANSQPGPVNASDDPITVHYLFTSCEQSELCFWNPLSSPLTWNPGDRLIFNNVRFRIEDLHG